MNGGFPSYDPCEALTVRQVGELLNVSRPTVERWIKAGMLPSLAMGGCRRILRSDLEAFEGRHRSCSWYPLRERGDGPRAEPPAVPPMCPVPDDYDDSRQGADIPF